ncbi:MAG TPA: hypothetical protein VII06_26120 [Chloroflexota bacterium]|jgi:hypothetical protein
MLTDLAQIAVVPGSATPGVCDLCATPASSLVAAVRIEHARRGSVRFAACDRCTMAIRRLAAVTGGQARFAVAPEAGSAHVPAPTARPTSRRTSDSAAVLIHERLEHVRGDDGRAYVPRIYGQPRVDGTWIGWVEFVTLDGSATRRTGSETTQSSREQVAYWASGLEALYFEGAFRRAQPACAPA